MNTALGEILDPIPSSRAPPRAFLALARGDRAHSRSRLEPGPLLVVPTMTHTRPPLKVGLIRKSSTIAGAARKVLSPSPPRRIKERGSGSSMGT